MKTNFKIRKSKIHGLGIFARKDFKKGEVVFAWIDNAKLLSKKEFQELPKKKFKYICHIGNKKFLLEKPFKYINHSCVPNLKKIRSGVDVAKRGIKKGEELTSKYFHDLIKYEFLKCNCGNKNCKFI